MVGMQFAAEAKWTSWRRSSFPRVTDGAIGPAPKNPTLAKTGLSVIRIYRSSASPPKVDEGRDMLRNDSPRSIFAHFLKFAFLVFRDGPRFY